MGKKEDNQPPSMLDNLDLFAPMPAAERPTPPSGLTGKGPMQELYDFNFRQYSAYVICSRAIPAVEDGLKPV